MSQTLPAVEILRDVGALAMPSEKIMVPEYAARNIILDVKGGYYGPWDNAITHLMVEPANCLTSRNYDAVVMVSSAQSAKTQCLGDNWALQTICQDHLDFLLVEKSQVESRNHSKTKVDRVIQASPNILAHLTKGHANNIHEKKTNAGAFLWIKWPTKNTLSGSTISRIALNDYDRFPDDIDGEGSAFDLAYGRRTYFGSRGMVMAESSPSKPIIDPKWTAQTAHEAPPTIGILGLYNTGDRRRVYSRCPHCDSWITLEASPETIHTPDGISDEGEAAWESSLICPASGCLLGMDDETRFKRNAFWVREGQTINPDGSLADDGRVSRRATFWASGWHASFSTWQSIISAYLMALHGYERTGDEDSLKSEINTKIGGPYWSNLDRAAADGKGNLEDRIENTWIRHHVPDGVRTITAIVDVQKRSFEVAIIGRGMDNERWIMDRFSIRTTEVAQEPIRPSVVSAHWQEITARVLLNAYRIDDNQWLRVHMMAVDSGGADGTTDLAYDYWRSLPAALKPRVMPVKGTASASGKGMTRLTRPDSRGRKDRPTGGQGDVPVLLIHANRAKDALALDLARDVPGQRYIHIPDWIGRKHLDELRSEIRDQKGAWKLIAGGKRNELWDHLYYESGVWDHNTRGGQVNPATLGHWFNSLETNSDVLTLDQKKRLRDRAFAHPKPVQRQPRRAARKSWTSKW